MRTVRTCRQTQLWHHMAAACAGWRAFALGSLSLERTAAVAWLPTPGAGKALLACTPELAVASSGALLATMRKVGGKRQQGGRHVHVS